jgi:hypothetical protein
MKGRVILTMVILAAVGACLLIAQPAVMRASEGSMNGAARPTVASEPTCSDPKPSEVWKCDVEQQILASTVRLQWYVRTRSGDGSRTAAGSIGHGTVKDGRFLVTHNHTKIVSLSDPEDGQLVEVSITQVNGELVWEGPLAAITIVVEDPKTLVLDFGAYRGEGMLAALGLPSAEFASWESLPLQPGIEVAQVNWDGTTTRVDWVVIDNITTDGDTPSLELANVAVPGASGGGVYWNGAHIANNWYQTSAVDASSETVLQDFTVAALNSPQAAGATVATEDEPAVLEGDLGTGGAP